MKTGEKEVWWNLPVKTVVKVAHNRSDIVEWNLVTKECKIIEITTPLDVNVVQRVEDKEQRYLSLVNQLKMMYPRYNYIIIPIVIGCLATVPKTLDNSLEQLQIERKDRELFIKKIQKLSLLGSMKIVRTALAYKT